MNNWLMLLLFIAPYYLFAQCPVSGLTVNSQAEVDAFITTYPSCTELNNQLRIEGADITNLNAFQNLTKLGGGLLMLNNPNLNSLTGFDQVTYIQGVSILDNPGLTNFNGLQNLQKIGGQMQIEANTNLQSFAGLGKLDSIMGQLFIYNNPALATLDGLDKLTHIDAGLILTICPLLTSCEIDGICSYLESPNGVVFIDFNGLGCDSAEEVEAACASCLQENIWKGPLNGSWHDASHWSANAIPDICHQVIIEAGKKVEVLTGTTAKAYTITIKNGGELIVKDAASLEIILAE